MKLVRTHIMLVVVAVVIFLGGVHVHGSTARGIVKALGKPKLAGFAGRVIQENAAAKRFETKSNPMLFVSQEISFCKKLESNDKHRGNLYMPADNERAVRQGHSYWDSEFAPYMGGKVAGGLGGIQLLKNDPKNLDPDNFHHNTMDHQWVVYTCDASALAAVDPKQYAKAHPEGNILCSITSRDDQSTNCQYVKAPGRSIYFVYYRDENWVAFLGTGFSTVIPDDGTVSAKAYNSYINNKCNAGFSLDGFSADVDAVRKQYKPESGTKEQVCDTYLLSNSIHDKYATFREHCLLKEEMAAVMKKAEWGSAVNILFKIGMTIAELAKHVPVVGDAVKLGFKIAGMVKMAVDVIGTLVELARNTITDPVVRKIMLLKMTEKFIEFRNVAGRACLVSFESDRLRMQVTLEKLLVANRQTGTSATSFDEFADGFKKASEFFNKAYGAVSTGFEDFKGASDSVNEDDAFKQKLRDAGVKLPAQ